MTKSKDKELVAIFREWQGLEDNTISLTEKLFSRTEDAFVKTMMSIMRHDSEKRRAQLQFALSHITRKTARIAQ